MVTEDLISYIEAQIKKGISRDEISSKLTAVGWHIEDIKEGLDKMMPEPVVSTPEISFDKIKESNKSFDPYRELPEIAKVDVIAPTLNKSGLPKLNISQEEVQKETPKVWTPESLKPKVSKVDAIDLDLDAPVKQQLIKQEPIKEEPTPKIEIPKTIEMPTKVETPKIIADLPVMKVETPIANKPIIKKEIPVVSLNNELEIRNEEISAPKIFSDVKIKSVQHKDQEKLPDIKTAPVVSPEIVTSEAITPSPMPIKSEPTVPVSLPKEEKPLISKIPTTIEMPMKVQVPIIETPMVKDSNASDLTKIAMTSSYARDLSSLNKIKSESNKKTIFRWVIITSILLLVGGTSFAFIKGYIKIPAVNINLFLIKKDPKGLLANNTAILRSLKSYKIDTSATLSSPSFANITSGLVSGEAVTSSDKDFISIDTKGLVNQTLLPSLSSDYSMTIKSSFLSNDINTDLKYDGRTLFITIPDLSQVISGNVPEQGIVAIPDEELNNVITLLPNNIQNEVQKVDLTKALPSIIASFVDNGTNAPLKDFANSVSFVEKNDENINGTDTYHYEINSDKPVTKKLLTSLMNIFTVNLSDAEKTNLSDALGSVNIDSFDIWIGKSDNVIHKYAFSLSIPLSKVIGLDDKGISDNEVKLDWQTTYYDFNIPNIVTMPQTTISLSDFTKNIQDISIKNIISSFSSVARNLYNAIGSYGKHSNLTGNCVSPSSGSLFSPVGYSKSSSTQVGNISSVMKDLLNRNNNTGYCYSTLNAWSLTSQLSDLQSFFCADSSGNSKTLTAPPTGTICK